MYEEKTVGSKCPNCADGKYVMNPKTQKVFCDKKCWLSPQEKQAEAVKQDHKEEKKTENISWMNARNNATQIVVAMYNKGAIGAGEIESYIGQWTEKINAISQPPF
jgi:hypothetical protein